VVLANRTTRTAVALAREFNPPAERRPAPRSSRGPSRGNMAAANAASSLIVAAGLDALKDRDLLATRTLVVNCTPVGLHGGDFLDYDVAATTPGCVHFDLAYGRKATPFLAMAARARRPTVDGRHMLVHQGAAAYALFTGAKAPVGVMLEACGVAIPRKAAAAKPKRAAKPSTKPATSSGTKSAAGKAPKKAAAQAPSKPARKPASRKPARKPRR
jgi:shikimate 5-dehydrogenase